jgi:hypothetical protein
MEIDFGDAVGKNQNRFDHEQNFRDSRFARAVELQLSAKKKTRRMLAWGVLGSASDGLPFLLTHPVVFRSICKH